MNTFTYCGVMLLVTLLSFPVTAQAMGSRHHSSEMAQNQSAPHNAAPQNGKTQTHDGVGLNTLANDPTTNGGTTSVPEPSSLLLLGIGVGAFAISAMIKRFRGQGAGREKAL
jgi:PEP-CTERM motif-containing protein